MKIALASDHAGFQLKEAVKAFLHNSGHLIADYGTDNEDSMDYPDTAHPAVQSVLKGENERAILICGTGQGMQLVANKYSGIRAALCWTGEIARLARLHNDANVLTMPGCFVDVQTGIEITKNWLDTPFEGGRHSRRVEKIEKHD